MASLRSLASWAHIRRWGGHGTFLRSVTPSRQNSWNPPSSFSTESPTPGWRGLAPNRAILTQRSRYSISALQYVEPLHPPRLPYSISTFLKVMFWFAGLVGMGMESKRVRRWLAASSTVVVGPALHTSTAEPPSYRTSFNPFPALVIGVTGTAMSAHAQAYLFQVESGWCPIHHI